MTFNPSDMNLKTKLIASFICVIGLAVVGGGVAYWSLGRLDSAAASASAADAKLYEHRSAHAGEADETTASLEKERNEAMRHFASDKAFVQYFVLGFALVTAVFGHGRPLQDRHRRRRRGSRGRGRVTERK